jgi:hypothetical protein
MAPASAHGNNGYGIYTTRPVRRGEAFLQGPDVPSIPILDYWLSSEDHATTTAAYNNETTDDRAAQQKAAAAAARRHFHNVFSNYWWTHGKPDHVAYLADQSADFQLTFGALPNHHCLLHSLEAHYPSSASNSITYAPYADRRAVQTPAAGAYSYNGGRVFVAGRDVQAGEEIYLNYGTFFLFVIIVADCSLAHPSHRPPLSGREIGIGIRTQVIANAIPMNQRNGITLSPCRPIMKKRPRLFTVITFRPI